MDRLSLRLPPALLLITACAFWGAATVLNKALLASIPPIALLVLQLAPSALALWAIVVVAKRPLAGGALMLPLILLGILNPGISYTLSLMGLMSVSASVATMLWAAEPLMILGLAALLLGETVTWRLLLTMLIGAIGVALVANIGSMLDGMSGDPTGTLLLLGAVLCCAFYTVFSRKLSEMADPVTTVAVQQSAGLAWALAVLAAGTRFGAPADFLDLSPGLLAAAVTSGLLYYAAAYCLYIAALRHVPAAIAGSYFNVIPVFGIGLAYLFLGERLTPLQWLGAAAILLSGYMLVRLTNRVEPAHSSS
ncbi:MAG: DMT family transporter [Pseudomonadota bacterium]